jgi:hypothetical protein
LSPDCACHPFIPKPPWLASPLLNHVGHQPLDCFRRPRVSCSQHVVVHTPVKYLRSFKIHLLTRSNPFLADLQTPQSRTSSLGLSPAISLVVRTEHDRSRWTCPCITPWFLRSLSPSLLKPPNPGPDIPWHDPLPHPIREHELHPRCDCPSVHPQTHPYETLNPQTPSPFLARTPKPWVTVPRSGPPSAFRSRRTERVSSPPRLTSAHSRSCRDKTL